MSFKGVSFEKYNVTDQRALPSGTGPQASLYIALNDLLKVYSSPEKSSEMRKYLKKSALPITGDQAYSFRQHCVNVA
jgi:hypothetical protein